MATTRRMRLSDLKPQAPEKWLRGRDLSHINTLAEAIRGGATLLPIVATAEGEIVDGNHRFFALKAVAADGKEGADAEAAAVRMEIEVEIVSGNPRELFETSMARNLKHGLPIPLDEKRTIFERVYAQYYKRETQERLAHIFGVHRVTIWRWIERFNGERGGNRFSSSPLPRTSPGAPRPAQSSIARVPVGPSSSPPPPIKDSLVEKAFDALQVCITYSRDDEVTPEGICALAESLEDTAKSLLLTSLREGMTKVIDGLEMFYKGLRRQPPWR